MNRRNVFLDAATILSSLLLVTGFICYRAGVFNRVLADGPQPATAPSNTEREIVIPLTGEITETLLPGSKSFDIASPLPTVAAPSRPGEVHRAPSQEQTVTTPQPNVTVIMSGSKSMFVPTSPIVPVGNQPAPPTTQPPPPPVPQTVAPTPAPQPAPTAPATPVLLPGSKSAYVPSFLPGLTPAPQPPAVQQQSAPQRKP